MTLQEAKEHQAKEFLIKRLNLSPIAASNVYREYVLACSEYAQSAAQEAREKAVDGIITELERRLTMIDNEPNRLVRDTMIDTLLVDLKEKK